MKDSYNAPVAPQDDGSIQEDPLYQEPSEGIATHSDDVDSPSGAGAVPFPE